MQWSWSQMSVNHCGRTYHAVHHRHPAHSFPHSHLHMLLRHQSTQPASGGVAARAAVLLVLAWAGACDRGTSPQEYTLCFQWTCWLGDAIHCRSGSPVLSAMQRAGDQAWPCISVLASFWVPCAAFCLAPSGGLVAENCLGPSPAPGGNQPPGPRVYPSFCKALSSFSLAQQLINHTVA